MVKGWTGMRVSNPKKDIQLQMALFLCSCTGPEFIGQSAVNLNPAGLINESYVCNFK
jgi:hypothetical protein